MAKSIKEQVGELEDATSVERRQKTVEAQLAAAKRLIAQQQARIEALSKSKFSLPSQKSRQPVGKTFIRVIVPDTHGCYLDPAAAAAFFSDLESLAPEEIVFIGDHIDCGGFLAQHHTMAYVAQSEYTFEQDVIASNAFFDRVQEICPKARMHYLEGNHERRLEQWCVTQALRNHADAEFLRKMFSVESFLNTSKRGINFYAQGKTYDNCRIPSCIKLGKCYFTHGSKHGKRAADQMLARFAAPVVFGHVHKLLAASDRNVKDGEVGAWCCGYLGILQPLWRHSDPTDWTQGYGVQLVRSDGDFLHINCPIINGRSYLVQLTERAGK